MGNPVITRDLIDDIKAQGVNSIRIPVTWDERQGGAPNYTIDSEYLDRFKATWTQGYPAHMVLAEKSSPRSTVRGQHAVAGLRRHRLDQPEPVDRRSGPRRLDPGRGRPPARRAPEPRGVARGHGRDRAVAQVRVATQAASDRQHAGELPSPARRGRGVRRPYPERSCQWARLAAVGAHVGALTWRRVGGRWIEAWQRNRPSMRAFSPRPVPGTRPSRVASLPDEPGTRPLKDWDQVVRADRSHHLVPAFTWSYLITRIFSCLDPLTTRGRGSDVRVRSNAVLPSPMLTSRPTSSLRWLLRRALRTSSNDRSSEKSSW